MIVSSRTSTFISSICVGVHTQLACCLRLPPAAEYLVIDLELRDIIDEITDNKEFWYESGRHIGKNAFK